MLDGNDVLLTIARNIFVIIKKQNLKCYQVHVVYKKDPYQILINLVEEFQYQMHAK